MNETTVHFITMEGDFISTHITRTFKRLSFAIARCDEWEDTFMWSSIKVTRDVDLDNNIITITAR